MSIPLEDNVSDIVGKAQRGLGISDGQLAARSGVTIEQIQQIRGGHLDNDAISRTAPILKLNAAALRKLAIGEWLTEPVEEIEGLGQFNSAYHDMTVNAYLVWDPATREAVAFDTGADCGDKLRCVGAKKLTVKMILLTHAHPDHVADLPRLRKNTGAPVYISNREAEPGVELIDAGKQFRV